MTRDPAKLSPVLLAVFVAAACGAGTGGAGHVSLPATRSCLGAAGFRVAGGHVNKEATNGTGAVGELIIPGAFIAFYPTTAIADRAASGVALNAALRRKLLDCLH